MQPSFAGVRRLDGYGRRFALPAGLLAALGVWACSDSGSVATAPEGDAPLFAAMNPGLKGNGGGRVDYPPGGPDKNTPQARFFQTWGINFMDGDADGMPDNGNVTVVDHRPQCGREPCRFKSVELTSIERADEECEAGGRGLRVQGQVRINDGPATSPFEVEVCDEGEPGNKGFVRDRFEFFVPGFVDPQTGQPYCLKDDTRFPPVQCMMGPDHTRGAQLTGGNIQVKT